MVEQQHEKIVVEKRGKKVALIIPFPEKSEHPVSSILSIAALDALPSQSDRFVGIVKEADLDYRDSRAGHLLAKYS
jgi:antitoxin (DNA-binding transcriptional repressor) of toxin-antitoxin stability system